MTSEATQKTELISIGWETLKRNTQEEVQKLHDRQAYLMGQKQLIDKELHQVELDIAGFSGGMIAGDQAVKVALSEQIAAAEDNKDPDGGTEE